MGLEEYQEDFAKAIESKLRRKELKRNKWLAPASFVISILALIIAFVSLFI